MSKAWYIYHVKNCHHATPPKDKLVVIACIDTNPWGFFINSEINNFIQKRPELLACQIVIKAATHKCLKHNSYVDCTNLRPYENAELNDIRERVDGQTKIAIKKAVAISRTIIKRHQKIILAN